RGGGPYPELLLHGEEADGGQQQRQRRIAAPRRPREDEGEERAEECRANERERFETGHRLHAVQHDVEQPLVVDPRAAVAPDREWIGSRQSMVLRDPAARGQVPEEVVAADRRNRCEREENEEDDAENPLPSRGVHPAM